MLQLPNHPNDKKEFFLHDYAKHFWFILSKVQEFYRKNGAFAGVISSFHLRYLIISKVTMDHLF
jgi:hypothetical protein